MSNSYKDFKPCLYPPLIVFQSRQYLFFFVPVPPEEIHIYDEHHADIAIMLGPYNEGNDVNLVCEVKGGEYYL